MNLTPDFFKQLLELLAWCQQDPTKYRQVILQTMPRIDTAPGTPQGVRLGIFEQPADSSNPLDPDTVLDAYQNCGTGSKFLTINLTDRVLQDPAALPGVITRALRTHFEPEPGSEPKIN